MDEKTKLANKETLSKILKSGFSGDINDLAIADQKQVKELLASSSEKLVSKFNENKLSVNDLNRMISNLENNFDEPSYESSLSHEKEDPQKTKLPAEIVKDLMAKDSVSPKWLTVDQLPGMASKGVRILHKMIFSQFTDTPPDKTITISTLAGHSVREMNAVAGWIRKNAIEDSETAGIIEHNFKEFVNGQQRINMMGKDVKSETKYYKTDNMGFLCVKDPMGEYIYGWSTKPSKKLKNERKRRLGRR